MKMRRTMSWLAAGLLVLACFCGRSARGEEEYLRFLKALESHGYGEAALAYIDRISADSQTPAEIRQLLDLERCNSLRVTAAKEAYSPEQTKKQMDEAKVYLEKFLKANPEHPAVGRALLSTGDVAVERAQQKLVLAKLAKSKEEQAKGYEEVRAILATEAQPVFLEGFNRFKVRYRELLKKVPEAPGPRERDKAVLRQYQKAKDAVAEMETDLVEARYKLAMIKYYISESYLDPRDATRNKLLEAASKEFDEIFQAYRDRQAGILAHTWQARCEEDLGHLDDARAIYEEVLVNAPDPGEANFDLATMYSQVEMFYLRLLQKVEPKKYVGEAKEWLDGGRQVLGGSSPSHKPWERVSFYWGIYLDLARIQFVQAQKAPRDEQKRMLRELKKRLTAGIKLDNEFKDDMVRLRKEIDQKTGGGEEESSDELMATADSLVEEGRLDEAVTLFEQAIPKSDPVKDAKKIAEIRRRLRLVKLNQGVALYTAQKFEETVKLVGPLAAAGDPKDPTTAKLAALGVNALLQVYYQVVNKQGATEAEKAAAMKRLEGAANFTVSNWPNSPEGDEARLSLGMALSARRDLTGALAVFEKVNPNSKRYASAEQLAGKTCFQMYMQKRQTTPAKYDKKTKQERDALLAKAEGDVKAAKTDRDAKLAKADRDALLAMADRDTLLAKTQAHLSTSLNVQKQVLKEGDPLPRQLIETQLLLGESLLEGGAPDKAVPLLDPLVAELQKNKPAAIDLTVTRIYFAAVQAHKNQGEIEKAGDVAMKLVETSDDNASVNGLIYSVIKFLEKEVLKQDGLKIQATDATTAEKAGAAAEKARTVYKQLLEKLAPRQQLDVAKTVLLGDACKDNGLIDQARDLYKRIVDKKDDPSFTADENNQKVLTRALVGLAGLLRDQGDNEGALNAVSALIKAHPNALEPLMEKGRILLTLANKDPEKFPEAVAHWADLRFRLERSAKTPKEYYEVVYNCSVCLASEARKQQDKAKLQQAEQLLKATMFKHPELSGEEMKNNYNRLIKVLEKLQKQMGDSAAPAAAKE
jgi:tetratricopeptide (TPR) repeat protein